MFNTDKDKIVKKDIVFIKKPFEVFFDTEDTLWIRTDKQEKSYPKGKYRDITLKISKIESTRFPILLFFFILLMACMGSWFICFHILSNYISNHLLLAGINLAISLFVLFSLIILLRQSFEVTVRYKDKDNIFKEDKIQHETYTFNVIFANMLLDLSYSIKDYFGMY